MATIQIVQNAIAQLDANNNEHWTADGLPRLDAVRTLAGDLTVTREEVNQASPGFIRPAVKAAAPAPWGDNASGQAAAAPWSANASDDESDAAHDDSEEDSAVASDTPLVAADFEAVPEITELSDDATVAEIQQRLHEATALMNSLERQKIAIEKEFKAAQAEVDSITRELEVLVPPETTSDALQGYFARQQQLLQDRASRMKMIQNSGLDLKALTAGLKSPIDAAMSRRTGRGGKRPSKI